MMIILLLGLGLLGLTRTHACDNQNQAGYHCMYNSTSGDCVHCARCFFPDSCLTNNSCATGTAGPTCETCSTGHYRLGSVCMPCPVAPWGAVFLGGVLLIVVIATIIHGFTATLATKVKQLGHFLQFLLLSLKMRSDWPSLIVQSLVFLPSVDFNLHTFIPAATLVIRAFACQNTLSTDVVLDHTDNVFLYDQQHTCSEMPFQIIQALSLLYLVLMVILLPLGLSFWILRLRKFNLLKQNLVTQGWMYESYRRRFCVLEPIVMMRKVLSILLTDLYPLQLLAQAGVNLCLSGIYLLVVVLGRPYRPAKWRVCGKVLPLDLHNIFEGLATVCVCYLQVIPIVKEADLYSDYMGIPLVVLISCTLLLWVIMLAGISKEIQLEEEMEYTVPVVPKQKEARKICVLAP
ncbi:PREDICTED: uncharacterized protein LOC109486137 [Branchiostoma belcheri]|uniref:Uncharacterized protein LOC109486137 n=1 Tax=Branchiostoma belcheri TaxID=7741 RepID=A0A6P5AGE0_BRABE|nr:PREDICTED: uncharacterized protein LOC109486137 [Branchiostoma belcheri]